MIDRLIKFNGVIAVYQIGSMRTPGISDIDMVVVFKEGACCDIDPRNDCSREDLYLFSHGLFGVSEKYLNDSQKYTFFHDYKHLWGEEIFAETSLHVDDSLNAQIKTQIAIEYLLKIFISMTVERTFGIYKVRGLLLQAKALTYDLEFLNIENHSIIELIDKITGWRNDWFIKKINTEELNHWIDEFYKEIYSLLKNLFQKKCFISLGKQIL